MNFLTAIVGHIGGTVLLLGRALKYAGSHPRQHRRFIEHCDHVAEPRIAVGLVTDLDDDTHRPARPQRHEHPRARCHCAVR